MACTECVRLSQIERAACYKSVHSIKFVSLLPHFASHCNTGEARMAMEGVNPNWKATHPLRPPPLIFPPHLFLVYEERKSVVAVSMGELPSNLG
jgi:hypothetical protein